MTTRPPLLSARAVAEILDARVERVYEIISEELLPAVRIGKTIRIDEGALNQWIAASGTAAQRTGARQPERLANPRLPPGRVDP